MDKYYTVRFASALADRPLRNNHSTICTAPSLTAPVRRITGRKFSA